MKKSIFVVSVLWLSALTMASAQEAKRESPEADCLVWWRLGSPLNTYRCLTAVEGSCSGATLSFTSAHLMHPKHTRFRNAERSPI